VISTGLTLLAERDAHELDMDFTIANRLVPGCVTGEVKINVEHGRKEEAVSCSATSSESPPGRSSRSGTLRGRLDVPGGGFSGALTRWTMRWCGRPTRSAAAAM